MKRRLFLGAMLGFVLNFQSTHNPFYIQNWVHETQTLYYDKVSEDQEAYFKKEIALNESK